MAQPVLRVREAEAVLRPPAEPEAGGRLDDVFFPERLLLRAGDAVFFAGAFLAAVFLAADFVAGAFLAAVFVAVVFFPVVFFAVAFFAVALLAVALLAVAFVVAVAFFAAADFAAADRAVAFFAVVFVAVVLFAAAFFAAADFAAGDVEAVDFEAGDVAAAVLAVLFLTAARFRAASVAPVPPVPRPATPFPFRRRDCVSQATAAPVSATGHSTSPATPSTPAPVYTITRRPRGDTAPIRSSAPSAALPTVVAPGTFCTAEAAACSGRGSVCADFCSAMTVRPRPVRAVGNPWEHHLPHNSAFPHLGRHPDGVTPTRHPFLVQTS